MPPTKKSLNSSEWVRQAKSKNLDADFLHQDKRRVMQFFREHSIPSYPYIFFRSLRSARVLKMLDGTPCFCRLIPKNNNQWRPARLGIRTPEELEEFCAPYKLRDYTPMLVKQGEITHTGGIIADLVSDGVIIELIRGTGPDLFHSKKTPFNAISGFFDTRTLKHRTETPPSERNLMYRALKHINWPSCPLPGYYEFDVLGGGDIRFRNYQDKDSAYATI